MKIINKSRKIIGINGEPLLPGADLELPEGMETHPVISYYLQKGIVVDSQNVSAEEKTGISDLEKARIEEEAIAKYVLLFFCLKNVMKKYVFYCKV